MTQWFRGHLEGHYVGTAAGKPGVSQYGSAERFKLRIYRAMVRDIEILDTAPEETPDVPDDCFYQAQIEDTRMLGIRPRSCFEGPIYDVSVSGLNVTHTTKKGAKTYGRVEGLVYGRYLLPEPTEDEEEELVRGTLTATDEAVLRGSEKPLVSEAPSGSVARDSEELAANDEGRDIEPLHPPTPPKERTDREPSHVPIPLLIVVMAVVLGLAGGAEPALLWLGAFVPIQAVRLILAGLFKVTNTQRVFGAILILVQVACLGLMLLDWWSDGCMGINVWAISGIGVTALIASVLPSSLPLLCAGGSLGLVLFLWYGDVGVRCEGPAAPKVETPAKRPTVHSPSVPRTNDDGSWPRRRSQN
tara:strand:- start:38461 stop:39537 length:1077 start_codon:yes stop_codon:yes gene_type:complete